MAADGRRGARLVPTLSASLLALVSAVCVAWAPGARGQETVGLSATRIEDRDEGAAVEGRAALVRAYVLTAKSPRFGGISGLRVSGGDLVAVSDRGHWLRYSLDRAPDGYLDGVGPTVRLEPLRDAGKLALEGSDGDAEGLAADTAGRLWVSFERGHRITRYDRLGGAAKAEAAQLPIRGLSSNSGVEGLAIAPDGALIAVVEGEVRARGRPRGAPEDAIIGWRLANGAATPFWIPRMDGFAATGADVGPDGELFLLERHYSFWTGVRLRIRRFAPRALTALAGHRTSRALALGPGRVIATLGPLGPVDNMEALSVERRTGGGVWLFVASDDNFSARQRNLLLQYAWPARR